MNEAMDVSNDDEREALTKRFADRIFTAGVRAPDSTIAMIAFKEVIAAFRRTEVPEPSAGTVLHLTDSLKMLRESLCAVHLRSAGSDRMTHAGRIGRIIAEIDRQRPLGSNGKHGDLHTPTCGCERPVPQGEPSDAPVLPDDCDCEDREALVRPEGLVCGTCDKVIAPGGVR